LVGGGVGGVVDSGHGVESAWARGKFVVSEVAVRTDLRERNSCQMASRSGVT
jgi:hypothetical protein